jgi:hypothetical protein
MGNCLWRFRYLYLQHHSSHLSPSGVMEKRGGYKVTRLTCKTAGVDGQNDRSSILPWVRPEIIYFFLLPISSFHMKYLHNAIDLESLL